MLLRLNLFSLCPNKLPPLVDYTTQFGLCLCSYVCAVDCYLGVFSDGPDSRTGNLHCWSFGLAPNRVITDPSLRSRRGGFMSSRGSWLGRNWGAAVGVGFESRIRTKSGRILAHSTSSTGRDICVRSATDARILFLFVSNIGRLTSLLCNMRILTRLLQVHQQTHTSYGIHPPP